MVDRPYIGMIGNRFNSGIFAPLVPAESELKVTGGLTAAFAGIRKPA